MALTLLWGHPDRGGPASTAAHWKQCCARLFRSRMHLEDLTDTDKAVVGQALRAAADGPFFPDWEFHTLFGLTRSEVRAIADAWPNVPLASESVALAVDNSLNNLLGYPHRQDSLWSEWISFEQDQLDELLNRLQDGKRGRYFERLR